MESQRPTGTMLESQSQAIAGDRLFRLSTEVYRGLRERGLIPEGVSLREGLLVDEEASGVPNERLYRMPLAIYEQLGPLGQDQREEPAVECLDGLLVTRMTRGLPHFVATLLVMKALERLVPAGAFVGKEDPVALPSGPSGHPSMPEPDVLVLRGAIRDYLARRPGPADIPLVVEVSDSSLREDRDKLVRYAWENVPVAWIVDLNARRVEIHDSPTGPSDAPGYRNLASFGQGEEVPVVLDGREVGRLPVSELLP
jgi:hypothetical protein